MPTDISRQEELANNIRFHKTGHCLGEGVSAKEEQEERSNTSPNQGILLTRRHRVRSEAVALIHLKPGNRLHNFNKVVLTRAARWASPVAGQIIEFRSRLDHTTDEKRVSLFGTVLPITVRAFVDSRAAFHEHLLRSKLIGPTLLLKLEFRGGIHRFFFRLLLDVGN